MIDEYVKKLVKYGMSKNLVKKEDEIFVTNRILETLALDEYTNPQVDDSFDLEDILKAILDYACEKGLIENTVVHRDLLDTKLMGCLTPLPSDVQCKFFELYQKSPVSATDWYYEFSQNTDYIRRYRICKDIKWSVETEYGNLDLSINLSKPEKDPKAIAAAKSAKQSGYPKCMLCLENEGYAGRLNHPARQNHRIIPIEICGEKWGFQYSPYVYYNEHCIVLDSKHIPMEINRSTFEKLFSFIKQFPHYFVGSNADLPIVGGSILSHDHFQGGRYEFAMERAEIEKHFTINGFDDVQTGIVKWPMSVIRLRHEDSSRIVELADYVLKKWRSYSDETVFVFSETNGEPHNTITPIARKSKKDGLYELDLVLRNNITTDEYPLGVFHPHKELHHIKKENIGLIEVMGLAVLPARLKEEFALLKTAILENKDIENEEKLKKHYEWVNEIKQKYSDINKDNIDEIIKTETGLVFKKVLECCGVFKRDVQGQNAFKNFFEFLNS